MTLSAESQPGNGILNLHRSIRRVASFAQSRRWSGSPPLAGPLSTPARSVGWLAWWLSSDMYWRVVCGSAGPSAPRRAPSSLQGGILGVSWRPVPDPGLAAELSRPSPSVVGGGRHP